MKNIYKNQDSLERLRKEIDNAESIVIGAGAGLSTSAGFVYSGERFERYFFDFADKFGITDMYSGGFYPFPDEETQWAWWSRLIYFNRYISPPKPVYQNLLNLVKDKNYFVLTTNVDHQFQRAGFDKNRLFYTQGDFGLFQSTDKRIRKTFDNEEWVIKALKSQGFIEGKDGILKMPENTGSIGENDLVTSGKVDEVNNIVYNGKISMRIPTDLIPKCPETGSSVVMNLRADDDFLEDDGWHKASQNYLDFLSKSKDKRTLFLELGVGANTPGIIKYPFWRMTMANHNSHYACINFGEAFCPKEIMDRSICIDDDIGNVLDELIKGD